MLDEILDCMKDLEDARVRLEEANESGDLEERLEAAQDVHDLEVMLGRLRLKDA